MRDYVDRGAFAKEMRMRPVEPHRDPNVHPHSAEAGGGVLEEIQRSEDLPGTTSAEDAFSAVPQSMRQGSFAMGANRMQTSLRVVVPAALSGVAAAVVLGMSRAIGETMIVTLAAGSLKNSTFDPREGAQTMTGFMATTAGGENPVGSIDYNNLFAVGMLLFVITLLLNLVSIRFVRRFRQVY